MVFKQLNSFFKQLNTSFMKLIIRPFAFLNLLCNGFMMLYSSDGQAQNVPVTTPPVSLSAVTIFPNLNNYVSYDSRNFLRTYTPQEATSNTTIIDISGSSPISLPCIITTAYFDGLGRPLQEVTRQGANYGTYDMVGVHAYDQNGRESTNYLPYSFLDAYSNRGKLKLTPLTQFSGQYSTLYPGQQPYAQINYDNSPLNRVIKNMAPGNSWVGSSLGKTIDYTDNGYAQDQVAIWGVDGSTGNPLFNDFYADDQLYVTTTTDEDGNISYEYKDKQGRIVLKKNFVKSVPVPSPVLLTVQLVYASTYYIYDDLGHLRWVLSPEAVTQSQPTAQNTPWTISQAILDGLCYHYEYDERSRQIMKKLPGKDAEYIVYDSKDRPVMTQDGNMRSTNTNKWAFVNYDLLDRPLCTGIYDAGTSGLNQTQLTSLINGSASYTLNTSNLLYYLQQSWLSGQYLNSVTDAELYTRTYYDDYSHSSTTYDPSWISQLTGQAPYAVTVPNNPSNQTRGQITGTDVKVLDGTGNTWVTTTNYFDDLGRPIQQQSNNILGGVDIITSQYDFSGTLISSVQYHTNPSIANSDADHQATTVVKRYTKNYSTGIIRMEEENINNTSWHTIYSNTYDQLGRINQKNLSAANNLYDYNVRGWLTGINAAQMDNQGTTDFFHEKLCYDQGFTDAHYNGNISGILWRGYGGGVTKRYYGYGYDKLDRLTKADFSEAQMNTTNWNKLHTDYTVSGIDYDLNGNLKHMNQRGPLPGSWQPCDMDLLSYQYDAASNKLLNVTDNGNNTPNPPAMLHGVPDFRDANMPSSVSNNDYDYDSNGNLTYDGNKGISSITYSYLNKPVHIEMQNQANQVQGTIDYLYDAQGNKLRKTTYDQTANTNTITDYDGSFVYQSVTPQGSQPAPTLQYILHDEGRCRPLLPVTNSIATYQYDYFIKDHLGNVRSVINAQQSGIGPWLSPAIHDYNTSLEVAQASTDALVWSHLDDVRADKPLATSTTDTKAAELIGTDTSKRIATAIMLRVMPGDQFSLSAQSYYDALDSNQATTGDQVLGSLLGALTGGSEYGGGQVEAGNLQVLNNTLGNPELPNVYNNLLSQAYDATAPDAYLNYLVFDENFNLVSGNSGVIQAGATANQWNTISTNGTVTVGQAGYLLVYASSLMSRSIYLDQTNLTFYSGALLEDNHYYPFGLTLTTSTTSATEKNNYKLTTKELQDDLGLNVYDFGARIHDEQTGRWWQMDPLIEKDRRSSPYSYLDGNVVKFFDATGMSNYLYDCQGNLIDMIKNDEPDQNYLQYDNGNYRWLTSQNGITESYSAIRVLSRESITGDPRENERAIAAGHAEGAVFNGILNDKYNDRSAREQIIYERLTNVEGYVGLIEASDRGSLDYKSVFSPGQLYQLGDIYMNDHEGLNYMWGATISEYNCRSYDTWFDLPVPLSRALADARAFNAWDFFSEILDRYLISQIMMKQ